MQAKHLYHRNIDYLVKDGVVKIVDATTGRVNDSRWSDGIHAVNP